LLLSKRVRVHSERKVKEPMRENKVMFYVEKRLVGGLKVPNQDIPVAFRGT
jgi:hypothetical protein